ncbi:uncharacterized protein [Procambarus clarkii]|uniref:uncharacterized protein n=1 Tax=Procambarus clarkii TaxID=6728 RepID=UPI003742E504
MDSKNPILRNALQRLCPSCNIIVNINQHVCKCGYRLFYVKRKAQPESQAQANIKRSEKKKHIPVVHDELHKSVQDLQHQKKLKEIEEEITRLRAIMIPKITTQKGGQLCTLALRLEKAEL